MEFFNELKRKYSNYTYSYLVLITECAGDFRFVGNTFHLQLNARHEIDDIVSTSEPVRGVNCKARILYRHKNMSITGSVNTQWIDDFWDKMPKLAQIQQGEITSVGKIFHAVDSDNTHYQITIRERRLIGSQMAQVDFHVLILD